MEQKQPLLSIVIPVYNSEKYLPAALDSVVRQTYQNLEIIIVNNGSQGNVGEIYSDFKKAYPHFRWNIINFEENQGLYHARLAGWKAMSGEYFTSMDSDDVVSVDYYYQLITHAIKENSDIVMAEYVNDFEEGGMKHYALNPMELTDICWENDEALKRFFEFHGGCFNLHAVWCKVYHRSIFEKALEHLEMVEPKIVLSEDILYSTVFFAFSKKVTNIHHVYYYHAVRTNVESSNIGANEDKIINGFRDQYEVFEEIRRFLIRIGRFEEVKDGYDQYRLGFVALIFTNLKIGAIPSWKRTQIENWALKTFDLKKPIYVEKEDWLFESLHSPFSNMRERALNKLHSKEIKYISFDIFDTLVERPFFNPDDTFEFLSREYNALKKTVLYVDFARLRRDAERRAREKIRIKSSYADITLGEIYTELCDSGVLTKAEAESMMRREIELELRFCTRRPVGYALYDYAKRCGKKVICISDMYLPKKVIEEILEKNGYTDVEAVFISGEERLCKYDQRLFKKVVSLLGVQPSEIAHFGDNYISDCVAPRDAGLVCEEESTYVPSAKELMTGRCGLSYTGNLFPSMFGEQQDPLARQHYLGTRCLLGVAQNRLFHNPYITYAPESAFNANPVYLGYFALGMYIFSIAKWLMEETSRLGYETIHFISRDGYLIKRAYDILTSKAKGTYPKSNYLYTSRRAMMPMMIHKKSDIFAMANMIDIGAYSPLMLLHQIVEIIPQDAYRKREEILDKAGILGNEKFKNMDEWTRFARVFLEFFYSENAIIKYRANMRVHFSQIIGKHDCTFDAGYSARTESILRDVTGNTIDAYYIFCNIERAFLCARQAGLTIRCFHHEAVDVNVLKTLETLICTPEPSCVGYLSNDGKFAYQFGKKQFEFQTRFMIDLIQSEAIRLVEDFTDTFQNEWETMSYRFAERPFMVVMAQSTWFDHDIFLAADFEDDLNSSLNDDNIASKWNAITRFDTVERTGLPAIVTVNYEPPACSNWKKAIYYLLFDRRTLKEKVKQQYGGHPVLLKLMHIGYSIPRGIYHLFK